MTPADSPENKCSTVECPDCGNTGKVEADKGVWDSPCMRCGRSPSVPDREGNEARNEAVRQFLEQVSDRDWYCATAEVEMALLTHDVKLPSDLCEERPLITWLRASSPSPDRETGADELVIEEHVPCEGDCEFCKETARAADDYQYEFDSTAESVAWLNGSLDASSGAFRWVPNSVEATAPSAPSAAPTDSGVNQTEGEGELRARIEAKARELDEAAAIWHKDWVKAAVPSERDHASSWADAYDSAAEALRSLLVPKEEA